MKNKNHYGNGGNIGITLFMVFLVLKLVGVISWSWWWVTSPLWIPLILVIVIILFVSFVDNISDGR